MEKGRSTLWTTWSGRVVVVLLATLAILGLVGLGFLLSNTVGAAQVAANARSLHITNATLGASGIARAAVAQAVFFSLESVSEGENRAVAITEARANLGAVATLGESLGPSLTPGLDPALADFVEIGNQVVDLAEQGRWAQADHIRVGRLEPVFVELSETLRTRQNDLADRIGDSERASGTISRTVFVAIAFLIPAIAIIVFWLVMRGRIMRLRQREAAMAARVHSEQRLNEAKDELIAGLSHELRTPLTTIYGFSEILLERHDFGQEERELLGMINASSADLSRMVNDLLTAARIDAGALTTQTEEVDLAVEVAAVVRPYLHQGHAIDVRVPPIAVRADPLHVRQVIHNLVSNAFRYGGENNLITASERAGSGLLLVADDGAGVPPEMEDAVFRRFVHSGRSSLVTGSVGLGLAICRELASKMGGTVRYERIGGWTAFVLGLPLYRADRGRPSLRLVAGEAG
jgi:signal transduction histidine kinase